MTKLNVPLDEVKPETEKSRFFKRAGAAAVKLAPIITGEIEKSALDMGEALIAVLLYLANFTRSASPPPSRQEFINACALAWDDSEEVFASSAVDVITNALLKVTNGWCQGELALKKVKDITQQRGYRWEPCHVKDPYAARWSALGAVDGASDAPSNNQLAREYLFMAVRDSGFAYAPGSLAITVLGDWNDYGMATRAPVLMLPPMPTDEATPEQKAAAEAAIQTAQDHYERVVKPAHAAKLDKRTKEQVIAVMTAALTLARRDAK